MNTADPAATTAPHRIRESGQSPRDTAHSRQRLLDAALTEFAAKGYAGARVRDIAQLAGVNTQLISYYFGGKEGLYRELMDTWHQQEARLHESQSIADAVVSYLRAFAAHPELLRMLIRDGLTRRMPVPVTPTELTVQGQTSQTFAVARKPARSAMISTPPTS